jgi:hypothetical protein
MNSLPQCICTRIPNFQNHSLNMASTTVSAFSFWIAVTIAHLAKASLMHSTNFLLPSVVSMGANKLAWILEFGHLGIGNGAEVSAFLGSVFAVGR